MYFYVYLPRKVEGRRNDSLPTTERSNVRSVWVVHDKVF